MSVSFRILSFFLCLGIFNGTGFGDDFPQPFNSEPISDQSLMSASESAASIKLPDGFRATAFAGEPDIQNPIAMTWDGRGRLWVAENYTYAERTQRFQLDLRDRVVILDGSNGDAATKRTVFTDNVQMLTGIEVGHDGVWLMCPPKLIFIPDRDHDDVPDNDGEIVLDGFEVARANYHNFANGLRFGPDGWLYGRCGGSCPGRIGKPDAPDHQRLALEGGIWRYHPTTQRYEVLTTGTTNPWGHDWNEFGEMFFINTVNGHLWHMIPGAHFTRPFTLDPNPRTYELIDFHADHWHFDTKGAWHESRDGVANSFGGGHAHCGTMIYQGGRWPAQYNGKLFTLNFHGRRANQELLDPVGSGYVARHEPDFFLSDDPWFRGMEISSGPDGNAMVLDWSDAGECHEHTGVHRTSGRVIKISSDGGVSRLADEPVMPVSDLRTWSATQLATSHQQTNHWYTQQARLELARRQSGSGDIGEARTLLTEYFHNADRPQVAVQSLLTLHSLGFASDELLASTLQHAEPHLRAWSIRMITDQWTIDDALGPAWIETEQATKIADEASRWLPTFIELATSDPSPVVRLALASTIQRLPVAMRASLATPLVAHASDAGDHNLPLMIWYGLIPVALESPGELVPVAAACQLPTTLRLMTRAMAEQMTELPEPIDRLIRIAVQRNDAAYTATVLAGISEGLRGWRTAPRPASWDRLIESDSATNNPNVRELSVVFGDGRAIDELKAIARGKTEADSEMRLSALQTLIDIEPSDLRQICESLLADAKMNVLAAQGLSKFDDPKIGKALVARYNNFRAPERPKIMSILVSRPNFAGEMLSAIDRGKISRNDLSAYQVRQIHSHGNEQLTKQVSEVWGEVRDTPEAKQQTIDALKKSLTAEVIASADKSHGRELFQKACQTCHRLYGEGAKVGPDLTGANRGNLDYLLSNIIDPSAVVDRDYRMSILLLDDDRIMNGLIIAETDQTVTLQTSTESLTINKDTIASRKITEKSPMPDGLFDALTPVQIRELIAYLSHPTQVPTP
ncbi:Cytochrome c [Rubripirellula tenax]|uniref:Cytochrome c n=1 Tax=Rubripirellula tenax TaxID=2528015 RepID=A0A5C6FGC2_9BACT|nr:PVC-type heme-binding CxxCH protein [Rubripirellula tenax]TWU58709.1 Cytochrome c [Rubripirellula tenax]